jgi:threonine dehydratase
LHPQQTRVHNLQVLTCSTLDQLAGLTLHFKAEVFQRGGSFKLRGACNAVYALSEEEAVRGVVTYSSGNHGAALALAARLRGIPAAVVVPSNTPQIKRAATRSYGVEPVVCEATIDAREAACAEIQARAGAIFIPPYNAKEVIAGQGTIGLEFIAQVALACL